MRTDGLIKSYRATAPIAKHRIVKAAANYTETTQAAAATDAIMGVNGSLPAVAGQVTDTVVSGYGLVEYGGAIAAGQPVTSDAQGRAIVATTAGQRLLGFANKPGALGDIGVVDIRLGYMVTGA